MTGASVGMRQANGSAMENFLERSFRQELGKEYPPEERSYNVGGRYDTAKLMLGSAKVNIHLQSAKGNRSYCIIPSALLERDSKIERTPPMNLERISPQSML